MKNLNNRRRIQILKRKKHEKKLKRNKKRQEKDKLKQLSYRINQLPKELQKKIYILTWRKYWRNFIPITAKIPSWTYHANYVKKQL